MYELNNDRTTDTIDTEKGNDETGKTETRKGNTPIYVWVTPTEKQIIRDVPKHFNAFNTALQ